MSELDKEFKERGDAAEKEEIAAYREHYEHLSIKELEAITTNTASTPTAIEVAFQIIDERKQKLQQ